MGLEATIARTQQKLKTEIKGTKMVDKRAKQCCRNLNVIKHRYMIKASWKDLQDSANTARVRDQSRKDMAWADLLGFNLQRGLKKSPRH